MAIKKNKKPYRPLSEIYLKESFARPVPLLPRQTILGEANGMAEILIQKDTGEDLPVYKVPNEVADEVLKRIKRAEQQLGDKEGFTVDKIIAQCLELDGWAGEGKGQNSSVFREVVNAFNAVELNYKEFNKLLSLQTDKDNPVRTVLLNDLKPHSMVELLSDKFKALFADPAGALTVLQSLWRLIPDGGKNVNVGPGELALTLISDAVKGKEGDLQFDFGLVEVKGNNAALGSGKYAVVNTYEELNRIMASKIGGASVRAINIDRQKSIILNLIDELIAQYDKFVADPASVKATPADTQLHVKTRELLKNLKIKASQAKSFQELVSDVQNSDLKEVKKTRTKTLPGEKAILLKELELLRRVEAGEVTSIAGGEKSRFNPAVNAFFSNPNLSEENKLEGIKFIVSDEKTNKDEVAEVAKELLSSYPDLLTWKSVGKSYEGDSTSDLNRFIGAVHLAEYQQEKKFKYIIFFNADRKDINKLPTRIVALSFANSSFKEDVKRVFEFFKDKDINASVKLGIDNTRGTVRIAIS